MPLSPCLHSNVALENLIEIEKGVGREIRAEKGAGRDKRVGREIGIGVKMVDIEMMWIEKETKEIGIETGTTSVTVAMTGKGECLIMFCKSLLLFLCRLLHPCFQMWRFFIGLLL